MGFERMCIVSLAISIGLFGLSIATSDFFRKREFSIGRKISAKRRAILSPLQIFILGFFASVVIVFYPIYYFDYFGAEIGQVKVIKSVLLSIHNSLRLFILDGDFDVIKNTINTNNISRAEIINAYTIYSAFLFVTAPLLSASFVLSFFKSISSLAKYLLYPKADIYLMSSLNERSITLAEDIMTNKDGKKRFIRKRLVLFADVFEKDEEENFELVNRAHRLGAICFKKDITEITLKAVHRGIFRKIYFIGEDENENIKQALAMIASCRNQKAYNVPKTQFYVFTNTIESEVLLNNADNGNMKVRRIKQSRNLALEILRTHSIFDKTYKDGDKKRISIAIVGLGHHGTELLKAICWCAQMPGYEAEIHVFDDDSNGEEQIESVAPELIEYNHKRIDGEAYYDIFFHNGINVTSASFLKEISQLAELTTVYVTLGNDELNIETAMRIRMQFGRDKMDYGRTIPPIFAIVYNSLKSDIFAEGGLKTIDGKNYGITFVGSMRERYSLSFVEQPELEVQALECHLRWVKSSNDDVKKQDKIKEKTLAFEKFEYFRRSSVATALYEQMRKSMGIVPGISDEMDSLISEYEHYRWNVYMRSEGYVYRYNNGEKDEISKTHYDLTIFDNLSDTEKQKDVFVTNSSHDL